MKSDPVHPAAQTERQLKDLAAVGIALSDPCAEWFFDLWQHFCFNLHATPKVFNISMVLAPSYPRMIPNRPNVTWMIAVSGSERGSKTMDNIWMNPFLSFVKLGSYMLHRDKSCQPHWPPLPPPNLSSNLLAKAPKPTMASLLEETLAMLGLGLPLRTARFES